MAIRYMDYTNPNLRYSYDLRQNTIFEKNQTNYVDALGIEQLHTIGNVYLLDVFLSKRNVVEPHYHPNASELIYCITGEAVVSFINPFTKELKNLPIGPQQVTTIPQGWWHYATAEEDDTHILAIHDTPELYTIWGSDVLRLTPPEVFAHTYCLDEGQIKQALAPMTETVIIGPPRDCHKQQDWGGYEGNNDHRSHQDPPSNRQRPSYPYYAGQPHSPYFP